VLKDPADILEGLRGHLCSQVDFVVSVQRMEAALPGAIYVDVGPRQTGSRLLQANGVRAERILRMDDREDPISQPLRVAFALLERGLPLDEAALMRMASEPRQTIWTRGAKGRLPYLVNGHAAVPLDGRPLPPSPLVPIRSTTLVENNDVSMPDQSSERLLEVYAEYQKTMRKFLESQDQVFSALAGGQTAEPKGPTTLQDRADIPVLTVSPPTPPVPPTVAAAQQLPMAQPEAVSAGAEPEQAFSSEQTLQRFITEVLVDRTGYPAELLELDAHLESDLGIDSIKQVEVLGALIEAMPVVPSSEQMQEIRAAAREKQTIRQLSGFMLALHEGKA
jgi:acyl carrier protein